MPESTGILQLHRNSTYDSSTAAVSLFCGVVVVENVVVRRMQLQKDRKLSLSGAEEHLTNINKYITDRCSLAWIGFSGTRRVETHLMRC